LARRESDASPHSRAASLAVRTASSTSAAEPSTTSACWAPVAGFHTGAAPRGEPEVVRPLIQCSIVRMRRPSVASDAFFRGIRCPPQGPGSTSSAMVPRSGVPRGRPGVLYSTAMSRTVSIILS
jgi:hypothetical protein